MLQRSEFLSSLLNPMLVRPVGRNAQRQHRTATGYLEDFLGPDCTAGAFDPVSAVLAILRRAGHEITRQPELVLQGGDLSHGPGCAASHSTTPTCPASRHPPDQAFPGGHGRARWRSAAFRWIANRIGIGMAMSESACESV